MVRIRASVFSGFVAQLVQMRMAVWFSSMRCQSESMKCCDNVSICALVKMGNCWLVGLSIKKLMPLACSALLMRIASSMACCAMSK